MEDFEDFAANLRDPAVTEFTTGKPLTEEEAWSKFIRHDALWRFFGFGFWAVEERETGAFLGEVGFGEFKRGISPAIKGIPEAGWILGPKAQGKGYGTEAAGAFVSWGDKHLNTPKTCCIVLEGNVVSIRLAEKLGYKEYARSSYQDQPAILFERYRA